MSRQVRASSLWPPGLADLTALFERRTEVEYALRKLLIPVLSYRYAFDEAAISKAIANALPKGDGDKTQLFVGRAPQDAVNELYLSDLKHAFVKNWDNFSAYFEKKSSRFEMNLDTINIARRFEAHTKPITQQQMDNFLNSYSWIKARLEKVPGLMSGSQNFPANNHNWSTVG